MSPRCARLPRAGSVPALLIALLAGCPASSPAPAADAGESPAPVHRVEVTGDPLARIAPLMRASERAVVEAVATPVDAVAPATPRRRRARARGWCAQIRAFDDRAQAEAVARAVADAGVPAAILTKDLGERGIWYRVCAGDEANRAALKPRADRWTEGALRAYLDPARAPGSPAWWPRERRAEDEIAPTPVAAAPLEPVKKPAATANTAVPFTAEQARTLLGEAPDAERPVFSLRGLEGQVLGAVTARDRAGIVVVDGAGRPVPILGETPIGCASCTGTAVTRRLVEVADLSAGSRGDELVVMTRDGQGGHWIEVLGARADGYLAIGGAVLGRDTESLRLDVAVKPQDADGDGRLDLAIQRRELQLAGERLCAMRHEGLVYRLGPRGAEELGSAFASAMGVAEQTGGDRAALALVAAFDALEDFDAGSESCAAFLARGRSATVARTCIGRVTALRERGHLVEAVNAAGTLASSTDALRAAVAGPFFKAAEALDQDPRLTSQPADCARQPLARRATTRSLDQLVRVARTRLLERLSLSDVATDVFVTGSRDFGPMTPVGKITDRWLERLQVTQPARRAAIDAVLAGGGQ